MSAGRMQSIRENGEELIGRDDEEAARSSGKYTEAEQATADQHEEEMEKEVRPLPLREDTKTDNNNNSSSNSDIIETRDGIAIAVHNNNDDVTFRTTVERWEHYCSLVAKDGEEAAAGRVSHLERVMRWRDLIEALPHARYELAEEYKTACDALENPEDAVKTSNFLIEKTQKLTSYVDNVAAAVGKVHGQLLSLAGRSQADPTQHPTQSLKGNDDDGSNNKRSHEKMSSEGRMSMDTAEKKELHDLGQLNPGTSCGLDDPSDLEYFNENGRRIAKFDELEVDHQIVLKNFDRLFQGIIQDATAVQKDKAKDADANKESLEQIKERLSWDDKYLKSDTTADDTTADTAADSDRDGQTSLQIPGPLADEEKQVQPFLLVFLQALGAFMERVDCAPQPKERKTPIKSGVQSNRIMPKTTSRAKRDVDKTIAVIDRYIFMFRDDLLEISVEEKGFARPSCTDPEKLVAGATSQGLGHSAKHVGIGFNFGAMGVDTKATAVILTPVFVKILQLRLVNMGRPGVKLVQYETKCLPLMSKTTFDRWLESAKNHSVVGPRIWKKWRKFGDELYDDVEDVPSGLVAISNLMTSTRADLTGADWLGCNNAESESSYKPPSVLGGLLGFGTFASVYAIKECENEVMKLSRYGAKIELTREASALRQLKCCPGITRLVEGLYNLPVKIGGVEAQLPALRLEPKGISVTMYLSMLSNEDEKNEKICKIGECIESALDSIAEKGYSHNDVSPSNILVKETGGSVVPFLVDFGLATNSDEEIRGFRGNTSFTHRQVFDRCPNKKWTKEMMMVESRSQFDKTSLSYSLAFIANDGKQLWKPFQPMDFSGKDVEKDEFKEWADRRAKSAWSQLEKVLPKDKHQHWKTLVWFVMTE